MQTAEKEAGPEKTIRSGGLLAGKVALVTGSSRGIGLAVARRLARDGATVIVNAMSSVASAEAAVESIRAEGGHATLAQADGSSSEAVVGLVDDAVARFGRLDVLVLNAWLGRVGPILGTTDETYDALFAFTRAAFFAMKRAGEVIGDDGRIIAISSNATRAPFGAAAYAGSKAAVEQFTRALAHEVGSRGITVNAILPGLIDTELLANLSTDQRAGALRATALRRMGHPEEIAELVGFLAAPHAAWITGELIGATGGRN